MKCPFLHGSGASATVASAESKTVALDQEKLELSRRTLLGYGSLTVGGMFMASVTGCSSSNSEEDDSAAVVVAGGFLEAYDKIATDNPPVAGESADDTKARMTRIIGARGALIGLWLKTKYNDLFAELRESRPVLVPGGPLPTLVALSEDVLKVMQDWDSFQVIPYQREMVRVVDHFTLEDASADPAQNAISQRRHDDEKKAFLDAMSGLSLDSFRTKIRAEADALVDASIARTPGRIEIVGELGRILPARVLGMYFGVHSQTNAPDWLKTAAAGAGFQIMTDQELHDHVANAFENFFLNITTRTAALQKAGTESSRALLSYIDNLAAARLSSGQQGEDLLGKFMGLARKYPGIFDRLPPVPGVPSDQSKASDGTELAGPRYSGLVANLFGIIVGAVTGITKSLANIMEILLTPNITGDAFRSAVSAAKQGHYNVLWQHAAEALRFKPQGSAIARACIKPATLQGVTIPPGSFVLASHPSAMHDPRAFPDPEKFVVNRPIDSYLHFGGRQLPQRAFGAGVEHFVCLGKELAIIEITEAVRALLVLKNVRRAATGGTLEDGPSFPKSLVLEHDGR